VQDIHPLTGNAGDIYPAFTHELKDEVRSGFRGRTEEPEGRRPETGIHVNPPTRVRRRAPQLPRQHDLKDWLWEYIKAAGICNHTFRGTDITAYLENPEAKLAHALQMAAHSDRKTRQLYDQLLRPALSQGKRSDLSGVRRREASHTDRGGLRSSTGVG
jgi:hypothetical protein